MNNIIEKSYTNHALNNDQNERCNSIRGKAKELACMIYELCPESRERSLAFTKLDETVMWANASIARNE